MIIRLYYNGKDTVLQCRRAEIVENGIIFHQTVLDDRIRVLMDHKTAMSYMNKLFKGENLDLRKFETYKTW